jgi:hypothetical protein
MKKFLITAAVLMLAPASALAGNPNLGKSDDYGSERFAQVNRCMVEHIEKNLPPDPEGKTIGQCMVDHGYHILGKWPRIRQ